MTFVVNDVPAVDEAGKEARENLVAFVRLADGETVQLHTGESVPDDADPAHVAALVERGVLSEAEAKAPAGAKPKG